MSLDVRAGTAEAPAPIYLCCREGFRFKARCRAVAVPCGVRVVVIEQPHPCARFVAYRAAAYLLVRIGAWFGGGVAQIANVKPLIARRAARVPHPRDKHPLERAPRGEVGDGRYKAVIRAARSPYKGAEPVRRIEPKHPVLVEIDPAAQ